AISAPSDPAATAIQSAAEALGSTMAAFRRDTLGRLASAPRIDLHSRGEPGHQHFARFLSRIDVNADRYPLHDLGEVAGGVLRRQQRELGAGSRCEARHGPVQIRAGECVDMNGRRLAGSHQPYLRLLEIRLE